MFGEVRLCYIFQRNADDEPPLAGRAAFYFNGMVEHSPPMFEQPGHRHIVDMAKQIEISKTRLGAVIERIICPFELPALWFWHL